MKNGIRGMMAAVALLAVPGPASAQVEALTIGAVSQGLSQAMNDFKSVAETLGGEVKGAGNSLQANAQNVLLDLDRAIAGNVNLTFDRLDTQQRALYRDAQALTRQLAKATAAVATQTASQARLAIADADILAYNTSYSLPCRSQMPRVVLVTPDMIRIGRDTPEVTVKGNFLDALPKGAVTVEGQSARVLSRSANEMRIEIPPALAASVKVRGSVSVVIAAQERKKTAILFFCRTTNRKTALQASALLLPRRSFTLAGWLQPTTVTSETKNQSHDFDSGRPGDCAANIDVTQNICAAADWTVTEISSFIITSKNCGSNAGPTSVSGARCVLVPGRVRGCGYDRYLGVRDCRGRGWVSWTMNVALARDIRTSLPKQDFTASSQDQASWSFPYQADTALKNPTWTYAARIDVIEGDQKNSYEISQAQEMAGPVKGRLIDGTLSITFDDGDL